MKTVAQSVSIRYRMDEQRRVPGSILSDQEFEFDNEVVNSRAYRDALARVAARHKRAPVEAPEYSIFLIPSEFCVGTPSDSALNCLTQDIVDDVFLKGYDGLDKRLKTRARRLKPGLAHRPRPAGPTQPQLGIALALLHLLCAVPLALGSELVRLRTRYRIQWLRARRRPSAPQLLRWWVAVTVGSTAHEDP
jgi:hypothetical protein